MQWDSPPAPSASPPTTFFTPCSPLVWQWTKVGDFVPSCPIPRQRTCPTVWTSMLGSMNITGRQNGSVSHHQIDHKQNISRVSSQYSSLDSPPVESDARRSDSDLYRFWSLWRYTFQNFCFQFLEESRKACFSTWLELLLSRQLGKSLLGSGGQELGNELSAPYEVPQFPIEQIESKIRRWVSFGLTSL